MKSKKFIPPTKEEVERFAVDNGFPAWLGLRAWTHYEDGDWHDTNGKPVKNWKQKVRTVWFNNYEDEHNGRNEKLSKSDAPTDILAKKLSELSVSRRSH